jgi:RimJ/RimL family protein N-acetyltransferase
MTGIEYQRLLIPDDRDSLADWLSSETWPFHASESGSREQALARIDGGDFSDARCSYWIVGRGQRLGLVRLLDLADLEDGDALIDLRLALGARGQEIGRQALDWLTDLAFREYPQLHRVAGTTRDDNLAMRAVFRHCGYALEGRFREAWVGADGARRDSLYFAILRGEWSSRRG